MRGLVLLQIFTVLSLTAFRFFSSGDVITELFRFSPVEHHEFIGIFFVDELGLEILGLSTILMAMITRFSRSYLHREPGYRHFFAVLALFLGGLNWVSTAGSFDLLFLGWEVVGIASFLLIGFYSHRAHTVRNALEVYSIYRFCDVGFLVSALVSIYLFKHAQVFAGQNLNTFGASLQTVHPAGIWGLSAAIILAAMGKSAQFPFSFWLSRAMEGPTPSSALFYGALSIHLGVFLLLRTEGLWGFSFGVRIAVFLIGLLTLVYSVCVVRIQSSIKGQIAYASIAQVGIMFMEVALGFREIAMFHLAANAFLRSYQLLVSPSSVAYFLRLQSSVSRITASNSPSFESYLPKEVRSTLLVLALRDAFLPELLRYFSNGILRFPKSLVGLAGEKRALLATTGFLLAAIFLPNTVLSATLLGGVLLFLNAIAVRTVKHRTLLPWVLIGLLTLTPAFYLVARVPNSKSAVTWFIGGTLPFWALTAMAVSLKTLFSVTVRKRMLWIGVLGTIGFPIGPAFLGEDLMIQFAAEQHPLFAVALCLSFVWSGFTAVRWLMHQPEALANEAVRA